MREIKFRAWDNVVNDMLANVQNHRNDEVFGFANMLVNSERFTFMQFTGLKDKAGTDIYEGDIISYYQPHAKRTDIHFVKWDTSFAGFGLFENGNEWCKESDWVKIQEIEIVGNIHEDKTK